MHKHNSIPTEILTTLIVSLKKTFLFSVLNRQHQEGILTSKMVILHSLFKTFFLVIAALIWFFSYIRENTVII